MLKRKNISILILGLFTLIYLSSTQILYAQNNTLSDSSNDVFVFKGGYIKPEQLISNSADYSYLDIISINWNQIDEVGLIVNITFEGSIKLTKIDSTHQLFLYFNINGTYSNNNEPPANINDCDRQFHIQISSGIKRFYFNTTHQESVDLIINDTNLGLILSNVEWYKDIEHVDLTDWVIYGISKERIEEDDAIDFIGWKNFQNELISKVPNQNIASYNSFIVVSIICLTGIIIKRNKLMKIK